MVLPAAFADPASVAVVGASDDRTKWGYWLAWGALSGQHRREVFLVNRRTDTVAAQPAVASLAELSSTPELVVIAVPADQVHDVVETALAQGSRNFLAVTGGVPDQAGLKAALDRAGARMIGPNSLGISRAETDLRLLWGDLPAGRLGVVTQSGQVGTEIALLGARRGLGVSGFYSVGNQLDLQAADVLESMVSDPETRTVALYLESFAGAPRLLAALGALREAGKHVLLLAGGASESSSRLARTHTGSLTTATDVVDAACRATGALRVSTPAELVGVAAYLDAAAPPRGRRLAVVSDSGGQGGIAADVAGTFGLATPELSGALQSEIRALLPTGAAVANPVDLSGAGEADLGVYARVAGLLSESGEVDAVLVSGYLGRYAEDSPDLLPAELAAVDRLADAAGPVPVVVHTMSEGGAAPERMRATGLPVYGTVGSALAGLDGAIRLQEHPGRPPRPRPAGTGTAVAGAPEPGYWPARALLAERGVAFPRGGLVDPAAPEAVVAGLAGPVVLKAGWIDHKTEHDAIRVGLCGADEVALAYKELRDRLGDGPYVVEEQDLRPDVVELLVGARRDREFGPTVTVGLGGVQTELWRDARMELAPVDAALVDQMLDTLTARALLAGWRGRPPVDRDAIAAVVIAVADLIVSSPDIAEIEINPLRVGPAGAIAVDALVVRGGPPTEEDES